MKNMNGRIRKFPDYRAIAQALLDQFTSTIAEKGTVSVAVSGGSTPLKIFEYWRDAQFGQWENVQIFWVDERVVPIDSVENNYGNALRIFGQNRTFPLGILHPMPTAGTELEATYQSVLDSKTSCIDIVLLGIGDDGHTASIFPGQQALLVAPERVAMSANPYTHQQRITLTGTEIMRSPVAIFVATGEGKRAIIDEIITPESKEKYPASYVFFTHPNATVFTDIAL